jgi:hypothetical protein
MQRTNGKGLSAVRQKKSYDLIAIALEQNIRAAQIPDLLIGPFDHSMAFAALRIEHLACRGDLETLLGAGFGFKFGHFASVSAGGQAP